MTENNDPCWDLLPQQPARFFELAEPFDMKDLKRAYNRLIRRFKPEQFPAEFQRIRSAYEALSDALRFNVPLSSTTASRDVDFSESQQAASRPQSHDSGSIDDVARHDAKRDRPQRTRRPSLSATMLERLAQESPRAIYSDLRVKVTKSADDFFALAVLSDLVEPVEVSGHEMFFRWLVDGLAEHPEDWRLADLARNYLREIQSHASLIEHLEALAKKSPPERLQFVCERAWERLFREAKFSDYRATFVAFSQQLERSREESLVAFYAHAVRFLVWELDDELAEELRQILSTAGDETSWWVQQQVEIGLELLEYRKARAKFLAHAPWCAKVDAALRSWCVLPESQGDQAMLDCHFYISQQGSRLLGNDLQSDLPVDAIVVAWHHASADVLERQPDPPELDPEACHEQAFASMIRIVRQGRRSGNHHTSLTLFVGSAILAIALVPIAIALLVRMIMYFADGAVLFGVLSLLALVVLIPLGLVAAVAGFFVGVRLNRITYSRRGIRAELMNLMRAAPLSTRELIHLIEAQEDRKFGENDTQVSDTAHIAKGMRNDAVLMLFNLAQRSVHAATQQTQVDTLQAEVVEEFRVDSRLINSGRR